MDHGQEGPRTTRHLSRPFLPPGPKPLPAWTCGASTAVALDGWRVRPDGSIRLWSSQVISLRIAAAPRTRRGEQSGRRAGGRSHGMAAKVISSPVPMEWYPTLAIVMVSVGLVFTASFFM